MAVSDPYPPSEVPHVEGPRPRRTSWWRHRAVRAGALVALLAVSGVVILALVREQTGTEGFLVGLGLAVLPVPLLTAAFRWLDRVAPSPWRNLVFCFAWGACAAALIAIVANSFAMNWIAANTPDRTDADALGATVIAPVVEETGKAAAVLLVFLFRRRDFTGIVDGVVVAGVTATGFAFTENILYLGNAYGMDADGGFPDGGLVDDTGADLPSMTVLTFFVRVVMSPFAHPLFTVLTGIGFGIAAHAAHRQRTRRVLAPVGGLLLAMGMHALWNGSAVFGGLGFFAVYASFMVPCFGLLTWLAIWTRQRELRMLREELPAYVRAGWLAPLEPRALASLRARRIARAHAARTQGRDAARAVADYQRCATSLALLRNRGRGGRAGADFVVRERALLDELWRHRGTARPAHAHAAWETAPAVPPVPASVPPWPVGPGYGPGYGYGYGYGAGYAGPHHPHSG
ncbi:PrsW family intramembrane metalloprotease [Streptomyces sp. O3]